MSQKYLAWNGEEYPWPPPKGWYEASDGRWWAPNSGPGPKEGKGPATKGINPQIDSQTSRPKDTFEADPTNRQPQIDGKQPAVFNQPASGNPQQQQPQFSTNPTNPTTQQQQFDTNPTNPTTQQQQFGTNPTNPQPFSGRAPSGFDQPQHGGPQEFNHEDSEGKGKILLIVGGIAAFLLVGVIAAVLLSRGSDETETATSSSTFAEEATTTSTEATTTTVEETTTMAPIDREAALAEFRTYVTGIDVVGLEDESLNGIGDEACEFGTNSVDNSDWNEQLDAIVASIKSQQEIKPPEDGTPLTDDAIREIYEGALVYYCPAEAERLDVTL